MATIKEELLVLGIRQMVVTYRYVSSRVITCCRGASVAWSLKLLALPYSSQ